MIVLCPGAEAVAISVLQAIVLGIVQGIGEFLPVSSSAHLYLVPWLLGWEAHDLAFDIALHMGTLVALVLVFWRDILRLLAAAFTQGLRTPEGRLAWGLVAATLPGALAGVLMSGMVQTVFRSPLLMAFNLALVGIVLYAVDRAATKAKPLAAGGFRDLMYMGIAQAAAIVPGVSRSGITMTAGLVRGLDRGAAATLSFWLAFPITLAAGIWELRHLQATDITPAFWAGVLTSAAVGYGVIRFLLEYLRRGTFLAFAVYRVVLAVVVAVTYFAGHSS